MLYLCPGELKALAVLSCGRQATSLTTGESGGIPANCRERLRGYKKVIIPRDTDDTGRMWAKVVRENLSEIGISVAVTDPPMPETEFCVKEVVETGRKINVAHEAGNDSVASNASHACATPVAGTEFFHVPTMCDIGRLGRSSAIPRPDYDAYGACTNIADIVRLDRRGAVYEELSIGREKWLYSVRKLLAELESYAEIPNEIYVEYPGSSEGRGANNWNAERRWLLRSIADGTYPSDYDIVTGMATLRIRRLIEIRNGTA